MSDNKKVWITNIDSICVVKSYSLKLNFPTIFSYQDYYAVEKKIKQTKDQQEKERIFDKEERPYLRKSIEIQQTYGSGDLLPEQPDKMYLVSRPIPKKKDYLFVATGDIVVLNQACADVLKQFNLGNTVLSPVQIYDRDTNELIKDDVYYVLNIAEKREFVTKEQTNEELKYEEFLGEWGYIVEHFCAKHKDVTNNSIVNINNVAAECDVDLWKDSLLSGYYCFMSDRLRNALVKAKLDKLWNIQPCNLV